MKDTADKQEKGTEPSEPEHESAKMSFLDHLDELRKRLVRVVTYLGVGFLLCWFYSKPIYSFLAKPILALNVKLVFTNPTDPFVMYMKVAFIGAIFLTVPLSLYEVWKSSAGSLFPW